MKPEKKGKRVQNIRKKEESLSYTVEVRDKEGKVIQRISAPSRSYVEQWNQLLNVQAAQAYKIIKDTGGTDRNITKDIYNLRAGGAVPYGIRVGKGTTAVAIDDYALEAPLGEGTGTDEFNHGGTGVAAPAVVGSTCSFTLTRLLINNSGVTISGIREIGCYVRGSSIYYFLGFRDILPGAVAIPDGGSITVIYTIAVTV